MHIPALGAFIAQFFQGPHPAFVSGATRLDTLPDPGFFLSQFFVEFGVLIGFIFQCGGFAADVIVVIALPGDQLPPIQVDDASRQLAQKGPVVSDEQDGTLKIEHLIFQPGNVFQIEMVGRLVQQQHFGLDHQRPGQRDPALPTARQAADRFVGRQIQLAQGRFDALLEVPAVFGFQFVLQITQLL